MLLNETIHTFHLLPIKKEGSAPEGAPEAKKAKKSDNPYPHIVTVTEVNTEGLTSSMIQKYFKPHRAIAVNVRASDKAADVAFKTHEAAVAAMEKQGENLNDASCKLILNSTEV